MEEQTEELKRITQNLLLRMFLIDVHTTLSNLNSNLVLIFEDFRKSLENERDFTQENYNKALEHLEKLRRLEAFHTLGLMKIYDNALLNQGVSI